MDQEAVVDASALVALLREESGAGVIAEVVDGAFVSAVNLAEVADVTARDQVSEAFTRSDIDALGLIVVPFTTDQALETAAMHPATRDAGLSLADRACLALARELGAVAITADHAWTEVEVGVEVRLIR